MGNKIFFKIEAMQKTGAFKIRGIINYLLSMKGKHNKLPDKIVAYSTGNHALGIAMAANQFGIKARVYLPQNVSKLKKKIAKDYGAEVIEVEDRAKAEQLSRDDAKNGFHFIHPSDSDEAIAGAGTVTFEAINQMQEMQVQAPDAIFASCGGGGLLSGTYLAKELAAPKAKVFGAEPKSADDAYQSLKQGSIFRFTESPLTIADGLRALSISPRTFEYLKKIDGIYRIEEEDICYWGIWLFQLLKIACEPSSAISMAAAKAWIVENNIRDKNILIIISGGNIEPEFYENLKNQGYLNSPPWI